MSKDITKYDDKRLEELSTLGMEQVDPADIRPSQILLVQKLTDTDELIDMEGNQPKVGEYFHTGTMKILDSFECYIVRAAKSKYIDRRYPEKGLLDQYRVVGVLDDGSVFGMTLRSSASYALSKLFSTAFSNKRPLFSIRVKMETKELENKQGKWFIPVCRIVAMEQDPVKLSMLEGVVMRLPKPGTNEIIEQDEETPETPDKQIASESVIKEEPVVEPNPTDENLEVVDVDKVPF